MINSSGELWSVGKGTEGQLGDGTTASKSSPVQVGSDTDWEFICSGQGRHAGVKTTGKLYVWGQEGNGYLGLGTTYTDRSAPTQVGLLTDWSKITAGSRQVLALKTDGSLWNFGRNNVGQLGDGGTANKSSPVQLGAKTDWVDIGSMDERSFMAINSSGKLYTWGYNTQGQLGHGNTTANSSPIQVGSLTDWATCGTGTGSHATKSDGTHWSWGKNDFGQLGLGDTVNRSSPVQVGSSVQWKPFDKVTGHSTLGIIL